MIAVYYQALEESAPGREGHAAGRRLLAHALRERWGVSVSPEELEGLLERGARGKPFLPALPRAFFSISHCKGLAVCAAGEVPMGADAEVPRKAEEALLEKILSPAERALFSQAAAGEKDLLFCRLWTLKESLLKCTGEGLSVPMRELSFTLPAKLGEGEIECSRKGFSFLQQRLGGAVVSLCAAGQIGEVRFYTTEP